MTRGAHILFLKRTVLHAYAPATRFPPSALKVNFKVFADTLGFVSPSEEKGNAKKYCIITFIASSVILMGYSHTLSQGRMGFLPREHHAHEAHRAQLEGRGREGYALQALRRRKKIHSSRGKGVEITFSYGERPFCLIKGGQRNPMSFKELNCSACLPAGGPRKLH